MDKSGEMKKLILVKKNPLDSVPRGWESFAK
jgi:hypothetical protein